MRTLLGIVLGLLLSLLTYVPGCEFLRPVVRSQYSGVHLPVPRSRNAAVEMFLSGNDPTRSYVVLGTVSVQARSRNTSLSNLMHYAQREARRMGGDAIIDIRFQQWTRSSEGIIKSTLEPRGMLTGTVVHVLPGPERSW